jgi:hypothetical protein
MATIWKGLLLLFALTQQCPAANPDRYFRNSGVIMAKIIEFYVPSSFRKKATKWIPPEQQGKVIPFDILQKKSA